MGKYGSMNIFNEMFYPEDFMSEERILNRFIIQWWLRWAGKDICISANEI